MIDPQPTKPPISPAAAIASTAVWGLVGLASLPMLLMSAMMFDAPGSEHNLYLWGIVASLIATPLLCLVSVVGGWIALFATQEWPPTRARAGRRLRVLLALLPVLGVAGVVVGFGLLQVACHGNFACR